MSGEMGAVIPNTPVITIPMTVTKTITKYTSKKVGVITQWYKIEKVTDDKGNVVEVKKIVDQVTVPLLQDKTKAYFVKTEKLKSALRKVVL